ncbi:glutamine amidotransferase [Pantoea vagans]|nr:glutamine amidotransferase [Pantoea vagans]
MDWGSNTLLLHPATSLKSGRMPDRFRFIHNHVAADGALMIVGG